MAALHFSKKDFEKKVIKSKKPVFVYFSAVWCPPCRMAGPIVDELAEEYKGKAVVGKINVDEEQELGSKFGVMSVPTVIVFKEGKEVDRKIGFPGKGGYQAMLDVVIK